MRFDGRDALVLSLAWYMYLSCAVILFGMFLLGLILHKFE